MFSVQVSPRRRADAPLACENALGSHHAGMKGEGSKAVPRFHPDMAANAYRAVSDDMRMQAGMNDGAPPAGGMTRRRFLEASAACVALPWRTMPVEAKGAGADEAPPTSDPLAEGFRTPPDSAKPWCYWWWLDSNATKEGITRDLEEMKRQGIVGALIFDAGRGTNLNGNDFSPRIRGGDDFDPVRGIGSPIGPLFMGPEWRELFKYAVEEANRLSINLSFNIVSGWYCGGNWVTPEHALHRLTWTRTIVCGPTILSRGLPQPPTTDGYYKEAAVLAFPILKFTPLAMDRAGVTLSASSTSAPGPEFLTLAFPEPFAASALYIAPNAFCATKNAQLQISTDGENYSTLVQFELEAGTPQTVTLDDVQARFYRVILPLGGSYPMEPSSVAWLRSGGRQSPWLVPVDDVQLLQQGEAPRPPLQPEVESRSAVNLTAKMDSSGRLSWSVPGGNWAVFRLGQTIYDGAGWQTLTKMASPGAQGYENDIMSTEALDAQLAETAVKLAADIGPLAGTTLKYLHIDSWECGDPNWTTHMVEEFKQRRGYDPTPYLAALTGTKVDSPEITNRFLRDLRRTAADLFGNFYTHFVDRARGMGLGVHAESGEWGPFSIIDSFMNFGHIDVPMGEFWVQDVNASLSVKLAASAAHGYGKKIIQAESFTSMGLNWEEDPWLLKKYVDPQFGAGLNRCMLCYYVHQPYLDMKPGYQWPDAGTHFDRNITWWDQSKAFFDYLSRCQFLLQQGRFVADVCYFAGEDAPSYCQVYNKTPAGYDNDSINGEVLMTRLSVKDGRLVLPDGMSYRVLVLPAQLTADPEAWKKLATQLGYQAPLWPPQTTITSEALNKIASLVEAGAILVGPRPTGSPSLRGYPDCDREVKALADKLWGPAEDDKAGTSAPASERAYGKGQVAWGKRVEEVLSARGILPDFTSEGSQLDFIHRSMSDAEIYFVSNQSDEAATAACTFRVGGRQPELWDPLNGEIRDAVAFTQTRDLRTTVPLELGPRGALFVVFRKPIEASKNGVGTRNFPVFSRIAEVRGPWTVRFDPKWGGPESAEFQELVDWTMRPEEGIKYYSGKATYVTTFEFETPDNDPPSGVYLNLGELNNIAEVRLNDKNLGVYWTKPFRVNISEAARSGRNDLEIDIVNLWPNRLIGDAHLPPEKWLCKTNVRNFTSDSPLLPSGLLGPVLLEAAANWHSQHVSAGIPSEMAPTFRA